MTDGSQTPVGILRLIFVFVLLAAALSVHAQLYDDPRQWIDNQSKTLEISSRIESQHACRDGTIKLSVKVTVKNVGKAPIVLCEDCMSTGGTFISKNVADFYRNRFVYDLFTGGTVGFAQVGNFQPDKPPFVTLNPTEASSFSIHPFLDTFRKRVVRPGRYILVNTILTWDGTDHLTNDIQRKWAPEGLYLWTNILISPPMQFVVDNGKLEDCDRNGAARE